jgi:hypothetical protein
MAQDVPPTFSGTVEADATFLGGAWKNGSLTYSVGNLWNKA